MQLARFEGIMDKYFDVCCESVGEAKPDSTLQSRARRFWLYSKPTRTTAPVVFLRSLSGTAGSEHEIQVMADHGGTYLSPYNIKRILAFFDVPNSDFYDACDCEEQSDK